MKKRTIAIIGLALCSNAAWAACKNTATHSTPKEAFKVHGDGTVTHTTTGLMWKTCSEGLSGDYCTQGTATKMNWAAALNYVNELNKNDGFAGHKDWRLPNIKELGSIVEEGCANPAINAAIFPNTVQNFYWSASPGAKMAGVAWVVHFATGKDAYGNKGGTFRVRLVRAAQAAQ